MHSKIIRFCRSKEFIIGFVFLFLLMNSMLAQAAPPLQEPSEATETAEATAELRETATAAPSNTPESTAEQLATATAEPQATATSEPQATATTEPTDLSQDQAATPTLDSVVGGCAIEGYVFNDLNQNQFYDLGEPPLEAILFLLPSEGDNNPITQLTTDQDGYFCFDSATVSPGSYRVRQEKISGYETISGQDRFVTVNAGTVAEVSFPNVKLATPTVEPTFTPADARPSPTLAETFTASPTSLASNTVTPTPSISLTPSATVPTSTLTPTQTPTQTGTPKPTDTPAPTRTTTQTPTQTVTPSITPSTSSTPTTSPTLTTSPTGTTSPTTTPTTTGTLRALTPIATFITTTPGVLVTTTPFLEAIEEGGDSDGTPVVSAPPPPPSAPGGPIHRLPETGLGGNWLAIAGFLALLMLGTGLTRRIFFNR